MKDQNKDKISLNIDNIDAFIFDFDGVLTNNLVYVDQEGKEMVCCSRSDGLAFDAINILKKPSYIISTEQNTIVTSRANKLKIPVLQGVNNKVEELKKLIKRENFDLAKIFYVGNDINDFHSMQLCGYSACPMDSHEYIKQIATYTLTKKGGSGVVREILEEIFHLDLIQIIYRM